MADTETEAVKLAGEDRGDAGSDRVLYGSVGTWEAADAYELRLPKGWKLIQQDQ